MLDAPDLGSAVSRERLAPEPELDGPPRPRGAHRGERGSRAQGVGDRGRELTPCHETVRVRRSSSEGTMKQTLRCPKCGNNRILCVSQVPDAQDLY